MLHFLTIDENVEHKNIPIKNNSMNIIQFGLQSDFGINEFLKPLKIFFLECEFFYISQK